jgi:replication-associated recombination protein RarA
VYPHDEPEGWVRQQYRPEEVADRYWQPTGRGADVERRRVDRREPE